MKLFTVHRFDDISYNYVADNLDVVIQYVKNNWERGEVKNISGFEETEYDNFEITQSAYETGFGCLLVYIKRTSSTNIYFVCKDMTDIMYMYDCGKIKDIHSITTIADNIRLILDKPIEIKNK